jgi:hypothetical protein
MGIETGIEWAHHTYNPWRGCTKVSEGCTNCYALTMSKRNPQVLGEWGPLGRRPVGNASYLRHPYKLSDYVESCENPAKEPVRCPFCGGEEHPFDGEGNLIDWSDWMAADNTESYHLIHATDCPLELLTALIEAEESDALVCR